MPETDEKGRIKSVQKIKDSKIHKTVIFETSGVIVPQKEQVQKYLDWKIIGESEIKNGTKYFVTQTKDEIVTGDKKEQATIALLKS